MDDLRALIEGLRKRVLVAHGGTGSPMLDHWNLTERDSLLHKSAADALDRIAAVERDAERYRAIRKYEAPPMSHDEYDARVDHFHAIAARKGEG